MKRLARLCVLLLLVVITTVSAQVQSVPAGWRLPAKEDQTGGWATSAKPGQVPYLAQADFNGDGITDDAYIALATSGQGWALIVNLNGKTGSPRTIMLDEDPGESPPQNMGVSVAFPGNHKTACGKGYGDCEDGEPPELTLALPAIEYQVFESANSFFWWHHETATFERTWMSD